MKYFVIFPIFGTLSHIFARFFFMRLYIIKRRRSFVCPFVNQSVLKQRGIQLRNMIQRYWRRFLRRPRSDFFKNRSRFFRMIFKNIFWDFCTKLFIYFTILFILAWYSWSTAPKFSIEIIIRNLEKTLKRFFFQKSF